MIDLLRNVAMRGKSLVCLAALAISLSACGKPGEDVRGGESPEDAIARRDAAAAANDWESFWQCHTEGPQVFLLGHQVVEAAMEVMTHRDREKELEALNSKYGFQKLVEGRGRDTLAEMFPGCHDHSKFFADLGRFSGKAGNAKAWPLARPWKIQDVRIEGDAATGTFTRADGVQGRIRFERIGGRWLIGREILRERVSVLGTAEDAGGAQKLAEAWQTATTTGDFGSVFDCFHASDRERASLLTLRDVWLRIESAEERAHLMAICRRFGLVVPEGSPEAFQQAILDTSDVDLDHAKVTTRPSRFCAGLKQPREFFTAVLDFDASRPDRREILSSCGWLWPREVACVRFAVDKVEVRGSAEGRKVKEPRNPPVLAAEDLRFLIYRRDAGWWIRPGE
ncbi:MAG: hypothetical protein HYY18_06020 [Planctomycetes bacterium]|nr:hypothetical protein [Planctomycetota bacterium]